MFDWKVLGKRFGFDHGWYGWLPVMDNFDVVHLLSLLACSISHSIMARLVRF
jgi:hypothetical protein